MGFVDTFLQVPLKAPDQINAYEDSIIGLNEGEKVNTDIYGYILNKKAFSKSRFALFWCKKRALGDLVQSVFRNRRPGPGAGLVFAAGLGFLAYQRRNKKRA